ncbi:MAG: Mpo1-like protein [Tahibacter sp.]
MARPGGILSWQWQDYASKHRSRANLLLHIVAVPAFIAGMLAALMLLVQLQWFGALFAFVFAVMAFAIQGIGHRLEGEAPEPFDGAGDFVTRVLAEQFITFPRFVLSGGWLRNVATGPGQD